MSALAAQGAFKAWLFDIALPFWADTGCDRASLDAVGLGAHEHLDAGGVPALPGFKRVRVQARQLVVFAQAASLGWDAGAAVARQIYGFMVRHARDLPLDRLPGRPWARRLTRAGDVLDPTADLYDLAFVLLALAWHARLTGSDEPLARADRLLEWLDRHMAHPSGGYCNTLPVEPGWRQQNPHMHLLEALLALFETTRAPQYARRAASLVQLFRTRLLDGASGTLGEFFDEDWSRAPGAAGEQVEPGHQYEWVWLLAEADRLIGTDTAAERAALYGFCGRSAIEPGTGLVYDELARDGRLRRGSARLWVQTEALRAHAVMGCESAMVRTVDNLLGRYFAHPVAGAWTDQLDAAFEPASAAIPASSLYHIVTGYAALQAGCRGAIGAPDCVPGFHAIHRAEKG